jgi:23S rRNA (cytosine1962-C5)-methyltransferase
MSTTSIPLDPGRFELLVTDGWADYQLVDMGAGRKLERYGPFLIDRPEEQAMGARRLSAEQWDAADAVFDGDADDSEGRWSAADHVTEQFPLAWNGLRFHGRFTAFRHLGVFPEQAAHWAWIDRRVRAAGRPLKILNLFGYTGIASLVAARAGAHVTHVDASKKSIAFARDNQALAGLEALPVRWIVDDAVKFVERELRRGHVYDGSILDPPKFGRGPNGETWQLFENLPKHLADCVRLLAPDADFLLAQVYAIRASFLALDDLARGLLAGRGGSLVSGELAIRTEDGDRLLSTSLHARWSRDP